MPESGKFPPATFPFRCPECDVPTDRAGEVEIPHPANAQMHTVEVFMTCGCGYRFKPYWYEPTPFDVRRILRMKS